MEAYEWNGDELLELIDAARNCEKGEQMQQEDDNNNNDDRKTLGEMSMNKTNKIEKSKKKILKCKECNIIFGHISNMSRHNSIYHQRFVALYKCTDCGKKGLRLDILVRHGRQVHQWNKQQEEEKKKTILTSVKMVTNKKYISKESEENEMQVADQSQNNDTSEDCLFPGENIPSGFFEQIDQKVHPTMAETPDEYVIAPAAPRDELWREKEMRNMEKKLMDKKIMRDSVIKECDELEAKTKEMRVLQARCEEYKELQAARRRITELEAENAALRIMAGKWLASQLQQ
jgi:hypothetical protein